MWKILRNHLSIADLILFGLILLMAVLAAHHFWQKSEHKRIYVYKDNLLFGEYPLYEDRLIAVDEHNTLEVKDGKVRMIEADCQDKRCVKQGYNDMLPIICLPNKLVVEIRENENERILIVR